MKNASQRSEGTKSNSKNETFIQTKKIEQRDIIRKHQDRHRAEQKFQVGKKEIQIKYTHMNMTTYKKEIFIYKRLR